MHASAMLVQSAMHPSPPPPCPLPVTPTHLHGVVRQLQARKLAAAHDAAHAGVLPLNLALDAHAFVTPLQEQQAEITYAM